MNHSIKNIIFDFGGVILNLDYQRTENAFVQLGFNNFSELYSQLAQSNLFDDYETGKITTDSFLQHIQTLAPHTSKEQITDAWNAMLLDLPKSKIDWIQTLRKQHKVFLFSNTNELHERAFNVEVKKVLGRENLDGYFDEVFLSHKIGFRKPHPEGFQYILHLHNLLPSETLFIDDSPQHIEGAQRLGLQTLYLPKGKDLKIELDILLS